MDNQITDVTDVAGLWCSSEWMCAEAWLFGLLLSLYMAFSENYIQHTIIDETYTQPDPHWSTHKHNQKQGHIVHVSKF